MVMLMGWGWGATVASSREGRNERKRAGGLFFSHGVDSDVIDKTVRRPGLLRVTTVISQCERICAYSASALEARVWLCPSSRLF